MSIADLRKSYQQGKLAEVDVAADPLLQFERWLNDAIAAEVPEPTAMTLATISPSGKPSTRIVLLKAYDLDHAPIAPVATGVDGSDGGNASDGGFVWYTNYDSRKGRDLKFCPFASLQFHWPEIERQVRIEGRVARTTAMESDLYFDSRPFDSRIGAWASPQSTVVPDRAFLEAREAEFKKKFADAPDGVVPRPPHWGGYRLIPETIEFWQGRVSRMHDRLVYRRNEAIGWKIERLAP